MDMDIDNDEKDLVNNTAQQQPQAGEPVENLTQVHAADEFNSILEGTLNRLTRSLPLHELKIVIHEAMECEAALMQEIRVLEQAISLPQPDEMEKKIRSEKVVDPNLTTTSTSILPTEYNPNLQSQVNVNFLSTTEDILATVFAPHDRYFTLSALLGRLREPLTTPPTPHSQKHSLESFEQLKKAAQRRVSSTSQPGDVNQISLPLLMKHKALLELHDKPVYTQQYPIDQHQTLLALWKRISNHRTALVFRKPVGEEAPGYRDKIHFPMDLSLVRKLITNGYISSFQQLHEYLGLICHNCIKFNGRESDYGVLTREFETYVDDSMLDTVQKLEAAALIPENEPGVTM